jgi:hypothetical protein
MGSKTKSKPITHMTRKIDGDFYTGVYRSDLKPRAKLFAKHVRQGSATKPGHKARVIKLQSAPPNAVFVDGVRENEVRTEGSDARQT